MYAFSQSPSPNKFSQSCLCCRVGTTGLYPLYACMRVRMSSYEFSDAETWLIRLEKTQTQVSYSTWLRSLSDSIYSRSFAFWFCQWQTLNENASSQHRTQFNATLSCASVRCFCRHRNFISDPLSKYVIQLNFFLCSAKQLPRQRKLLSFSFNRKKTHTIVTTPHTAMNSLSISNYIKDVWPIAADDVRRVIVRCSSHPLTHLLIYNASCYRGETSHEQRKMLTTNNIKRILFNTNESKGPLSNGVVIHFPTPHALNRQTHAISRRRRRRRMQRQGQPFSCVPHKFSIFR